MPTTGGGHCETTASPLRCPNSPRGMDRPHNSPKLCKQHRQDLPGLQPMTYYINREEGRYHETVAQFDDKAEALKMKAEYQLSEFGRAYYYVSQVARPGWED